MPSIAVYYLPNKFRWEIVTPVKDSNGFFTAEVATRHAEVEALAEAARESSKTGFPVQFTQAEK